MTFGTVKSFDTRSGFGVIRRDDNGADIHVYSEQLKTSSLTSLEVGRNVTFTPATINGLNQATYVFVLGRSKAAPPTAAPPAISGLSLVEMAQQRAKAAGHSPVTLEAWNGVLDYIKTGKTRCIYVQETTGGSWGSKQPGFRGEWSKLSAWCKLVGLKLSWEDLQTGAGIGRDWTWTLALNAETCGLPSNQLKEKLITEHGTPPGY